MAIAFFTAIILGVIAVLLSWELDLSKKKLDSEKKEEENRIYKLSIFLEFQQKIAHISDPEKVIDTIMSYLRKFFAYTAASSMVIKDSKIIFKAYVEEKINNDYLNRIEKSMLSSLSQFVENLPGKTERKFYGVDINDTVKTSYSSSFHIPLIVKNKIAALIHLSSTKESLYNDRNMETLYQLMEIAGSSLTHFQESLDTEKNIFISLTESIKDGIFMADNKNNLILINDSAKKYLKLLQNNISFSDVVKNFPKSLNLMPKIKETILNAKPFMAKEVHLLNDDKIFDIFITPADQNKASIVLHDMTEYKKAEISKEDTTHIMIHELRAPITTIKDSAELIISTENALDENKKLKFLEIINQQAKKILDQIGSILDTAKLDAGKLTLERTKGDIAKSVKTEMESFMPQAQRKNIALNLNIPNNDLPLIYFDVIRITQVIDNLLSNSLKFTPEDGNINVKIEYKAIPPTPDNSSMKDFLSLDKYIVVSVSDTGIGIPKEQQKFLFSRYTQTKNTSQQLAKLGTGLGLYLVKGIVEAHGGRVWIESEPGQGTTIFFSLPADDAKKTYDEPKTTRSSPLSTVN